MIRNLKALGPLTVAALAMSAMAVSAAQAEVTLTAGKTPSTHTTTKVHGEQEGPITENYFEAGGTKIACTKGKSYGVVPGGATGELTMEGIAEECGITSGGIISSHNVTVTNEGCDSRFAPPTRIEENTYTGEVSLICPEGKKPIVHIFANAAHTIKLCTIEIEPNQAGFVVYHNKTNAGAPDSITATSALEGTKYVTNGAGCPENGKTKENGKTVGNAILTSGETNASQETVSLEDDLWLSGT